MKFIKQKYRVLKRDQYNEYTDNIVEGVAIDNLFGIHKKSSIYVVSHIPSGYSVCKFNQLWRARLFLEVLYEYNLVDLEKARNSSPDIAVEAFDRKKLRVLIDSLHIANKKSCYKPDKLLQVA